MEQMEQPATNLYIIYVCGVPISCEFMEFHRNNSHFLATYG